MKQTTFASMTYQAKKKRTRREKFLADMDQVVPRAELQKESITLSQLVFKLVKSAALSASYAS